MIRFDDLKKETTVSFLKQTLYKMMVGEQFSEDAKANSYLLLGDMALKNYKVLDDDINVAIAAFTKLREIISLLERGAN